MGIVQFIHCEVRSLQRAITIKPRGRSVLIVGQNGAGKTSLLNAIFESLNNYVRYGHKNEQTHKNQLRQHLENIKNYPQNELSSLEYIRKIRKSYVDGRKAGFFKVSDVEKLSESMSGNRAVLKLFKAHRQADIQQVHSARAAVKDNPRTDSNQTLSADLEQHLVNLRVRSALAQLAGNEHIKTKEIEAWFDKFERDVQYLFEDESVRLIFDADHMRYFISQHGRLNYSFQELSSGYSAIFDIFGDLVVRSEYLGITPEELQGVVFIDEIDAHLHVSLQRKILPFLIQSFPNIQFIVTTHSPFVLSSVDDVLIYDVSSGKSALDLSMYSVDAILEGLLGVPPISKKLEDKIKYLSRYTGSNNFDLVKAVELIDEVIPFVDSLDEESRMYFEISKNKVLRAEKGGRGV
ncbi:ATPase AAA [Pseudomonas putida]|nr:ATPase AAA [Pseudomonas putida]